MEIYKLSVVVRQLFSHPLEALGLIAVIDFRSHSKDEHRQFLGERLQNFMNNRQRNECALLLIHFNAKIIKEHWRFRHQLGEIIVDHFVLGQVHGGVVVRIGVVQSQHEQLLDGQRLEKHVLAHALEIAENELVHVLLQHRVRLDEHELSFKLD